MESAQTLPRSRTEPATRYPGLRAVAVLGALMALIALRIPFLDDPALWIDEAFSIHHAKHDLRMIWGEGWELESSPPLYYTVYWLWSRIVGEGEVLARLLSLLLTAGAAYFVFRATALLAGRRAGILSTMLFLAQPLVFHYSLEIRPYPLQLLLLAMALASFARALVDFEQARITGPGIAARRAAPIVAFCALATYTHATTPIFVLALGLTALLFGLRRHASRGYWITVAASAGTWLAAIQPQLLVMAQVLQTNQEGIAWIPSPVDPRSLFGVFRSLAVGENVWNTVTSWLVGITTVAVIGWSAWRLRRRPAPLFIGFSLPVTGFALLWSVSLAQSVLLPRTALWVAIPLCLLVGCAFSTIRANAPPLRLAAGALATGLILMLSLMSVINLNARNGDRPWARFIEAFQSEVTPEDEVVAVDPELLCVLDAYADTGLRSASWSVLDRGSAAIFRSRQRIGLGCNERPGRSVGDLMDLIGAGRRVWVLAGDDRQRRDVEAMLEMLPTSVRAQPRLEWRGRTHVWQLRPD